MLPKSQNYNTIWNDPSHYAETKLVVGSTTYGENVIMGLDRTQTLFADYYNIGNTVMGQIEFTLYGVTAAQLPRMSRVEVWTRLWAGDGSDSTDWLPMGVYYTGKPEYDTEAQLLSVNAYDEMYKTGVVPFEGGVSVTAWDNPTLRAVAKHIIEGTTVADVIDSNFAGIGLELEDPTQILDTITMPSIPYNFTVREILADIAVACCGNWTMVFQDDSGSQKAVLRLVKNADWTSPTLLNLGRDVTSFEKGDDITPVTDVYVYYGYDSNGASVYGHAEATPNDGREYEVSVQTITDGTQANLMAAEILAGLGSTFYHPYSATGAELDPATELGDTLTINSITSIVGAVSCSFNQGMWADISAEGLEPVDDFDYLSGSARQADRIERSAEVNSAKIEVNAREIVAQVEAINETIEGVQEDYNTKITQTASDITVSLQHYAQDQVNNHAVEQQQYIRYSADGLELGASGTNAKALLDNTSLKFYDPSNDVKARIGVDELFNPQANALVQGHISSSGTDVYSTIRVTTGGYIQVSPSTQYRITSNIPYCYVIEFNSSASSGLVKMGDILGIPGTFTTTATTNYIRVTLRNADGGTNITPSDVTELSIQATSGDYKFFVINGHIVNQLELGNNWLLVASSSDNDNRLTFKWRG